MLNGYTSEICYLLNTGIASLFLIDDKLGSAYRMELSFSAANVEKKNKTGINSPIL